MATYFEDLSVGETDAVGEYRVTAEEIVSFAERYDPQPIHVDESAARASTFGGLIASGWHTCSVTMRMLVDGFFEDARALGAVGVDRLRFPAPVRPDDRLSATVEIAGKEDWDDERGLVRCAVETSDEDDRTVLTMEGLVLWERREPVDRPDDGESAGEEATDE